MEKKILVFDDKDKINNFLIEKFLNIGKDCINKNGFYVVAFSGGNTPREFYKKFFSINNESFFIKTHFFVVDERYVDINDENSNSGMIKKCIGKKKINFYPFDTTFEIKKAALKYEELIKDFFNQNNKTDFSFDVILLGIGKDGHTASIFPNTTFEESTLVVPIIQKKAGFSRITMTLNLINRAKNVFFLVVGEEKAKIVKEVINKEKNYPACKVEANENLFFVLDKKAASLL